MKINIGKAMPFYYQTVSVFLMAWAILTMPLAIVEFISRLKDVPSLLTRPADNFIDEFGGLFGWKLHEYLPTWAVSLVYIFVLLSCMGFYYWAHILSNAQKIQKHITGLELMDFAEPQPELSPAEATGFWGGLASAIFGAIVLEPISFFGGLAAMVTAIFSSNDSDEKARQRETARRQQYEENRRRVPIREALKYVKSERQKLLISSAIIFGLVIFSYVVPPFLAK